MNSQLPPDVRLILESAASQCLGVTVADVVSPGQQKQIVQARRIAARRLRARGLSLPEIGRYLGHRHHTTILHLLQDEPRRAVKQQPKFVVPVPDLSGEWAI